MKFLQSLFVAVLVLLLAAPAFAGDTYNQDVDIHLDPNGKFVVFSGTITMTDSTGNYFTKAMDIGAFNGVDGYLNVYCSEVGTEDVNGFVLYSNYENPTNAVDVAAATDSDLDALGTTVVSDTLGTSILHHTHRWMVLKFDGQTGSQQTVITWSVFLPARDGAIITKRPAVVAFPAS